MVATKCLYKPARKNSLKVKLMNQLVHLNQLLQPHSNLSRMRSQLRLFWLIEVTAPLSRKLETLNVQVPH